MNYLITHHPAENYIETVIKGTLNKTDLDSMIKDLLHLIKETQCPLLLSDYREAKLDVKFMEIYEIPNKISDMAQDTNVQIAKIKRALVINDDKETYAFFETVSFNRGQNVKLFTDIDEAKRWLLAS